MRGVGGDLGGRNMIAKEASIKDVVETEPHRLEVPFFREDMYGKKKTGRKCCRRLKILTRKDRSGAQ